MATQLATPGRLADPRTMRRGLVVHRRPWASIPSVRPVQRVPGRPLWSTKVRRLGYTIECRAGHATTGYAVQRKTPNATRRTATRTGGDHLIPPQTIIGPASPTRRPVEIERPGSTRSQLSLSHPAHCHRCSEIVTSAVASLIMAIRMKCAFATCDRESTHRDLCQSHYNQRRRGAELTPLRPLMGQVRGCTFEGGCDRPHLAQGLCRGHYSQRRAGSNLTVLPPTKEKTCTFDDCLRPIYARRLCSAHYQQHRKTGSLSPLYDWVIRPDDTCNALSDCERRPVSAGLCRSHYDQKKRGQSFTSLRPLTSPADKCLGPQCARKAESDEQLCRSHGMMQRRGQMLAPLVQRTSPEEGAELIGRGMYWCTFCQEELPLSRFTLDGQRGLPRSACKLCLGIDTRARKHQRTFLDIHLLFEFQEYKCAICGIAHQDDAGLHLDHDHRCCPKKGESCGKCIRGLLCWGCNGGVIPWYERIRGTEEPYAPLEKYLEQTPASALGLVEPF